jgi:antitoxin CptB
MTALDQRRRRAAYRASHRGTKEMDWLLGRYAEVHLPAMEEAELARFERLLALPDPDLQAWIMTGHVRAGNDLSGLVAQIRIFHGLAASSGAGAP